MRKADDKNLQRWFSSESSPLVQGLGNVLSIVINSHSSEKFLIETSSEFAPGKMVVSNGYGCELNLRRNRRINLLYQQRGAISGDTARQRVSL